MVVGGSQPIPGSGGGGILSSGTLNLFGSTIANNNAWSGGGLASISGTLTLTNSVVSGNSASFDGGGIEVYYSVATLSNTSVSDNSAHWGGGLNNSGTLVLSNSTVARNTASYFYNGDVHGPGGGIFSSGLATLANSTVSGNNAAETGGGLYNAGGTATLTNSTVSGNSSEAGGGLYNGRRFTYGGFYDGFVGLTNSIVANSTGGDCGGTAPITDNGHNWFDDVTCSGSAQGDPKLEPLADNGGPTWTHALSSGSGAIDAGDNAVCTAALVRGLDQRGEPRPGGGSAFCDIGAFEAGSASGAAAAFVPMIYRYLKAARAARP